MTWAQEEGQTPGRQVFFLTLPWAMVQRGATLEMKMADFLEVAFSLHLEPVLSAWTSRFLPRITWALHAPGGGSSPTKTPAQAELEKHPQPSPLLGPRHQPWAT